MFISTGQLVRAHPFSRSLWPETWRVLGMPVGRATQQTDRQTDILQEGQPQPSSAVRVSLTPPLPPTPSQLLPRRPRLHLLREVMPVGGFSFSVSAKNGGEGANVWPCWSLRDNREQPLPNVSGWIKSRGWPGYRVSALLLYLFSVHGWVLPERRCGPFGCEAVSS